MCIKEIYQDIRAKLMAAGITEYDSEARIIMREVCGISYADILSHPEKAADESAVNRINEIIKRRLMREPLQYILGNWDFMGLNFCVGRNVLIPRPDTEVLVESALKELHDGMRILDLCTGTGCIAISLLHYSNDCSGTAVDISEDALTLARTNAERILRDDSDTSESAAGSLPLEFIYSDLYDEVKGKYDIIVSNPPYINTDVIDTLEPEVRTYEPHLALDGGQDGLDLIKRIIGGAKDHIVPGGTMLMEIGADQGERVLALYDQAGFIDVHCIKDYAGSDRVVMGRYPILHI